MTEAEEEPGLKRRYCFATLGCLLILAAVVISILIAGRNRVNEFPLYFFVCYCTRAYFLTDPSLSIPVGLLNPLLGISPSHSFPEGSVPSVLEGEVRLAHLDWLDTMDNTSSHVFKALASLMEVELKQLLDKDKLHLHHMEEEKLQIHHHRMNHSNVRVIVTQLLPGSVIFR